MMRIVLVFGLIAGAIMAGVMLVTLPLMDRIGFDKSMVIGYTSMVVAFLLVFFGIRSYRENVGGGSISFGRAFATGVLITVVACVCYVAAWQVIYFKLVPDFVDQYTEYMIEKERAAGASQQQLDAKSAQLARYRDMYRNPFINAAITFIEPLPVGLVLSLVSAGLLSRRRRQRQ